MDNHISAVCRMARFAIALHFPGHTVSANPSIVHVAVIRLELGLNGEVQVFVDEDELWQDVKKYTSHPVRHVI